MHCHCAREGVNVAGNNVIQFFDLWLIHNSVKNFRSLPLQQFNYFLKSVDILPEHLFRDRCKVTNILHDKRTTSSRKIRLSREKCITSKRRLHLSRDKSTTPKRKNRGPSRNFDSTSRLRNTVNATQ